MREQYRVRASSSVVITYRIVDLLQSGWDGDELLDAGTESFDIVVPVLRKISMNQCVRDDLLSKHTIMSRMLVDRRDGS